MSLKVDLVTCVTDMFNRQQVSSDPGIRLYDKQVHFEYIASLHLVAEPPALHGILPPEDGYCWPVRCCPSRLLYTKGLKDAAGGTKAVCRIKRVKESWNI